MALLFGQAYSKAATIQIALSGFKVTSINPLNPNIFPDHLFLPCSVVDINQNIEEDASNELTSSLGNIGVSNLCMNQSVSEPSKSFANQNLEWSAIQFSTSSDNQHATCVNVVKEKRKETGDIILQELSLMPIASRSVRPKPKSTYESILASTPFVNKLREEKAEKRERAIRKSNTAPVKRILVESDDETEPFVNDDDDSDVPCIYCNDLFSRSKSREKWIRCQKCKEWDHADYAGVSRKTNCFICEACLN